MLLLGIAFILMLAHDFLKWLYGLLKPKPRVSRQRILTEFMYDRYPYERHWVVPDEDSEYSELKGFESSAEMDLEDEED
jgi:hypothetical protein